MFAPIIVENINLERLYIDEIILNKKAFIFRVFFSSTYNGANTGNVRNIS